MRYTTICISDRIEKNMIIIVATIPNHMELIQIYRAIMKLVEEERYVARATIANTEEEAIQAASRIAADMVSDRG